MRTAVGTATPFAWRDLNESRGRRLSLRSLLRSASGGANQISEKPRCRLLALNGHARRIHRCPLSGVNRTSRLQGVMSAFDPKRTWSVHRNDRGCLCDQLLDHLVSACEQSPRYVKVERLRGLEVDGQFVLGWRLHGQVGEMCASLHTRPSRLSSWSTAPSPMAPDGSRWRTFSRVTVTRY